MASETKPFIQVYCPECQAMIRPGEWALCPYFGGKRLDYSATEDALRQIFRCHVQCGCEIQYQYYEQGGLVTRSAASVEDPEQLRHILALVLKSMACRADASPKRILLADDDPDFLEMHAAVLRNRGYAVRTAASARECLERLAEEQPDIIVLDVMMESFDAGFAACRKIKEQHADLPVLLVTSIGAQTGLDFSSSDEVLAATGADALLDKPVSPKVFIDAIERLTGAEKARPEG